MIQRGRTGIRPPPKTGFTDPTKTNCCEEADNMRELWKDTEGLTTVEYALLLALVVVAGIAAWQGLGTQVGTTVNASSGTIANAGT